MIETTTRCDTPAFAAAVVRVWVADVVAVRGAGQVQHGRDPGERLVDAEPLDEVADDVLDALGRRAADRWAPAEDAHRLPRRLQPRDGQTPQGAGASGDEHGRGHAPTLHPVTGSPGDKLLASRSILVILGVVSAGGAAAPDPGGRHVRLTPHPYAAGLAAVAALLLGACSSADPTPPPSTRSSASVATTSGGTSPTSSATSTTPPASATTTAAGDPDVPAAARANTAAGAEAFTAYFFAQVNLSYANAKPELMDSLVEPSCKTCAGFRETVVDLSKKGSISTETSRLRHRLPWPPSELDQLRRLSRPLPQAFGCRFKQLGHHDDRTQKPQRLCIP